MDQQAFNAMVSVRPTLSTTSDCFEADLMVMEFCPIDRIHVYMRNRIPEKVTSGYIPILRTYMF